MERQPRFAAGHDVGDLRETTPSGRFAAISPSRGEKVSASLSPPAPFVRDFPQAAAQDVPALAPISAKAGFATGASRW